MARKAITLGAATSYTVKDRLDNGATILALTTLTVVQLPDCSPANKGQRIRVINVGTSGAVKVSLSPHASDKLVGSTYGAAGGALVALSGTADKDAENTAATALKGDFIDAISDGVDTWFCHGVGVWASQS
jgi:hypothetical protein